MGHGLSITVTSEVFLGREGRLAVHNVHSASLGANIGVYTFFKHQGWFSLEYD